MKNFLIEFCFLSRFVLSMCHGGCAVHFLIKQEAYEGKKVFTFDTDQEAGPKIASLPRVYTYN